MHKDRKFWWKRERERAVWWRMHSKGWIYLLIFIFVLRLISYSLPMYRARNWSAALTCSFFSFIRLNITNIKLLKNSTSKALTVGNGGAQCNSQRQPVNIHSTAVHKKLQPGIAAFPAQRDTAAMAGRSSEIIYGGKWGVCPTLFSASLCSLSLSWNWACRVSHASWEWKESTRSWNPHPDVWWGKHTRCQWHPAPVNAQRLTLNGECTWIVFFFLASFFIIDNKPFAIHEICSLYLAGYDDMLMFHADSNGHPAMNVKKKKKPRMCSTVRWVHSEPAPYHRSTGAIFFSCACAAPLAEPAELHWVKCSVDRCWPLMLRVSGSQWRSGWARRLRPKGWVPFCV